MPAASPAHSPTDHLPVHSICWLWHQHTLVVHGVCSRHTHTMVPMQPLHSLTGIPTSSSLTTSAVLEEGQFTFNINCICCRKVMWSCDLHFTIVLFSDGISSPNDHHNSRFIGMCSLITHVSNRNSNKNYITNLNIFTVAKSNVLKADGK